MARVVECRVYPDVVAVVGPGEKAADEHFPEYVQAAVVEVAAFEEPRPAMASYARSGEGGGRETRASEDPPIYSERPQCLCGPSEAYLAARPRLKNLVRATPAPGVACALSCHYDPAAARQRAPARRCRRARLSHTCAAYLPGAPPATLCHQSLTLSLSLSRAVSRALLMVVTLSGSQ